jgi:hypothetical protein
LTDLLQCDNSEENDEFVRLFTGDLDTVSNTFEFNDSSDQRDHNDQSQNSPVSSNLDDYVLNQSGIQRLDNDLHGLPKEIYVTKLLSLCSDDDRLMLYGIEMSCVRELRKLKVVRKEI